MDLQRDLIRGDGPVFAALALTAIAAQMSVAFGQILLGLALLLALVRLLLRRDRFTPAGVELPGLLLIGWALLMILFSTDPDESLVRAKRFYLFTALWLCAGYVRGEGRRGLLLAAAIFGAAFNCVYSILVEAWPLPEYAGRLGLMQNSVITGSWLVMAGALLALAQVMHGSGLWARLLSGLAGAPMIVALLLTQSRSAWLGFAAGAAVVAGARSKRWLAVLAVAGALVFLVGPDAFRERLRTIVDPSYRTNTQRFEVWERGWELVREHPVTGVGDVDLRPFSPDVLITNSETRTTRLGHFHSNAVMMAVLWGVPGLGLGVWFLGALWLRLWRGFRLNAGIASGGDPHRRVWLAAALGVWTGLVVTGVFDWSFGDPEFTLVAFSTFGAALALD